MTEHVPQTSAEQRAELARLAGEATNGNLNDPETHRCIRAYLKIVHDPAKITALLADLAAAEAECQRLREMAEDDGTKDALEESLCELMDECFQLDADDCPMPAAPGSGAYRGGWFDARKLCLARIKGRICGLAHLYGTRYTKEETEDDREARAALGVAPEPQGDDCGDSDEEEKPYNVCDCCGTSMIDDTEIGCGTCYPCQAEIARLSEEAPDEP